MSTGSERRSFPLVFGACVLLAASGFDRSSPVLGADVPRGQRVFIAGHSFHMPMAQPLEEISKAAGLKDASLAGKQGLGGSSVSNHWELPDEKDRARKAIRAGAVDVLTLSPYLRPLPDPAIEKFTTLLLEHNPQGRVTLQASWYPMDSPVNLFRRFRNEERDAADPTTFRRNWAPLLDRITTQAKSINEHHSKLVKRQVVFVVPVGEAVIRLRERVAKGNVPGIARQSDLFRDSLGHGKEPLSVLTAYCHFAVIYGTCPVGLPVPRALESANLGENTAKVNRILQEVAWEAVLSEPLSGVTAAPAVPVTSQPSGSILSGTRSE